MKLEIVCTNPRIKRTITPVPIMLKITAHGPTDKMELRSLWKQLKQQPVYGLSMGPDHDLPIDVLCVPLADTEMVRGFLRARVQADG